MKKSIIIILSINLYFFSCNSNQQKLENNIWSLASKTPDQKNEQIWFKNDSSFLFIKENVLGGSNGSYFTLYDSILNLTINHTDNKFDFRFVKNRLQLIQKNNSHNIVKEYIPIPLNKNSKKEFMANWNKANRTDLPSGIYELGLDLGVDESTQISLLRKFDRKGKNFSYEHPKTLSFYNVLGFQKLYNPNDTLTKLIVPPNHINDLILYYRYEDSEYSFIVTQSEDGHYEESNWKCNISTDTTINNLEAYNFIFSKLSPEYREEKYVFRTFKTEQMIDDPLNILPDSLHSDIYSVTLILNNRNKTKVILNKSNKGLEITKVINE